MSNELVIQSGLLSLVTVCLVVSPTVLTVGSFLTVLGLWVLAYKRNKA